MSPSFLPGCSGTFPRTWEVEEGARLELVQQLVWEQGSGRGWGLVSEEAEKRVVVEKRNVCACGGFGMEQVQEVSEEVLPLGVLALVEKQGEGVAALQLL